jgi:hypothetical protein
LLLSATLKRFTSSFVKFLWIKAVHFVKMRQMDAFDQKLRELESQVWELLPSLENPRLKSLLADITHLKRAKEILGSSQLFLGAGASIPALDSTVVPDRSPNRNGMTRGDAMVQILRETEPGKGLHVKRIVERLKAYDFDVSTHSAVGIMRGDTQQRFKKLGHSYYDLADHVRSGNVGPYTPSPAFRRIKGLNMTLRQAILLVTEGRTTEFGQPEVFVLLRGHFPLAAPQIMKETVSVTLNNMKKDGLLYEVFAGRGRYPKLYVRADAMKATEVESTLTAMRDGYGRTVSEDDVAANSNELAEAV